MKGPLLSLQTSMVETMNRTLFCILLLASPLLSGCGLAKSADVVPPPPMPQGIIQSKACERDSNGFTLPCQFDNPVTAGDLIVVAGIGVCNPLLPITGPRCDSVSDSQMNLWKRTAVNIGFFNGIDLFYVLDTKGGLETIYFAPNTHWWDVIAEYPPSTGFEAANAATYYGDGVPEHDNIGWTRPIETHESCELLISWTLHGPGPAVAGPYFTLRADNNDVLALEDSTTTIPGYYMAGMSWHYANAWMEGVAAFKMGGCK